MGSRRPALLGLAVLCRVVSGEFSAYRDESQPGDVIPTRLGPRFTRLWTAATVSNVGDGLLVAALPLLAIRSTTSPLLISGLAACRGLPWLLFGLTAGAIVDRVDRRRLMALVDYGRGAVLLAMSVAVVVSDVPIWVLYVVALGLGLGEVLFDSASGAFVPMVVPDAMLERANSRLYLSLTVANELSGPAVGAWLFAAAAAAPFIVDAGSFVFAASMVLTIRGNFRPAPVVGDDGEVRVRAQIAEGIRFVREHAVLRSLVMVSAGYNFLATGLEALVVLYITTTLGGSDRQYGLVLTLAAIGGIAGGLVAERVFARVRHGIVIVAVLLGCAGFAFTAAAIGELWAFTVSEVMVFFGSALASIGAQTLRQRAMPPHLAGRIMSVYLLCIFGAGPLGAVAFGVLARVTSVASVLVAFGVGCALLAATLGRVLVRASTAN
jgi:MFS family permease